MLFYIKKNFFVIWTIYCFFFVFLFYFFVFLFSFLEKNKTETGGEWNPVALLVFRWQGDTPKRDVVPELAKNFQLLECEILLEKIQRLAFRDTSSPTLLTGQKRGQPEGHETTLLFGMEGVRDLFLVWWDEELIRLHSIWFHAGGHCRCPIPLVEDQTLHRLKCVGGDLRHHHAAHLFWEGVNLPVREVRDRQQSCSAEMVPDFQGFQFLPWSGTVSQPLNGVCVLDALLQGIPRERQDGQDHQDGLDGGFSNDRLKQVTGAKLLRQKLLGRQTIGDFIRHDGDFFQDLVNGHLVNGLSRGRRRIHLVNFSCWKNQTRKATSEQENKRTREQAIKRTDCRECRIDLLGQVSKKPSVCV